MNDIQKNKNPKTAEIPGFELGDFFPYLVRIYYRAVSTAVSNVYTRPYGLSVSEWRTMAVLGPLKSLSASEIVTRSSMDKVNVSRAIKGLQARGFLKRHTDNNDKRKAVLELTEKGNDTFADLIGKVRQVEVDCLDGLTGDERATLIALMEKVRNNAEKLIQIDTQKVQK